MKRSLMTAAALLALVGCADSSLTAMENGLPGGAAESYAGGLRVDVYPSADLGGGALMPQTFLGLETQGDALALILEEPVTVSGRMTGFDANPTASVGVPGTAETPVQGFVLAQIPNTPVDRIIPVDASGRFQADVAPGEGYLLAWVPEVPNDLPFNVAVDQALFEDTDLSLYLDQAPLVIGSVTTADDVAVEGAHVQLMHPATGVEGPIVPVELDGGFSLRAYPGEYVLRTWDPSDNRTPVQELPVEIRSDAGEHVEVYYPSLATVLATGEILDDQGSGLANVRVVFESEELDGLPYGSFSQETTTNESGLYSSRLPPGTYTVTVTPDADHPLGPTQLADVTVQDATDLGLVELSPRPVVQLALVGVDNVPLAGVLVQATEVGHAGFVYETVTNADGVMVLPVSDGPLEWAFVPPVESGAATRFTVKTPEELSLEPVLVLQPGELVEGQVSFKGDPAPYCLIEVRDLDDRLYGTAVTDADGAFTVRVYSELR